MSGCGPLVADPVAGDTAAALIRQFAHALVLALQPRSLWAEDYLAHRLFQFVAILKQAGPPIEPSVSSADVTWRFKPPEERKG